MYPRAEKTKPQKRAQLMDLLTNKFRAKYNVILAKERELDHLIQLEITAVLNEVKSLQEKDLAALDVKIGTAVRNFRNLPPNDANSVAQSTKSSQHSVRSQMMVQPQQSKEMSDKEWSELVNHNFNQYQLEEKSKKEQMQKQRDTLKHELMLQVQAKAEQEKRQKELDLLKSKQDLQRFDDAHQQQEEIKKQRQNELVKRVNPGQQFELESKRKFDEMKQQKALEWQERQLVEQKVKEAQELEVRLDKERRLHLKAMTEQDRHQKLTQKLSAVKLDSDLGGTFAKHLHERPTHQAYDRRAKQDHVLSIIQDKFLNESQAKEKLVNHLVNSDQGFNDQFGKADQNVKSQTQQMKVLLDQQIERAKQHEQMKKDEVKMIGQQQAMEHKQFEEDERKRKQDILARNLLHQSEIKKQIQVRSQVWKNVGAAVMQQ